MTIFWKGNGSKYNGGWRDKTRMRIQGLNVHDAIKHSLEDRYTNDKSIQTWKRSYLLVFFAHNPYKTDR